MIVYSKPSSTDSADPDFDPALILEVLARHGVEYLLVGGLATQRYGATRGTRDFDCLARRTDENLERLALAMVDLNARLRVGGLTEEEARALPVRLDVESLRAMRLSNWRTDAGDFDVLADIPARDGARRDFEDLVAGAMEQRVGDIRVLIAGLADIIASKQHANRPKDHAALPELEALAHELGLGLGDSGRGVTSEGL